MATTWTILLNGRRRDVALDGIEGAAIGTILDLLAVITHAEFVGWTRRISPSLPRFRGA